MLSSVHGKSGGDTARFSGTGAAALASGAAAGQGSSSVRGGAAGRRAPAIGESLGATTGSGRIAWFEESRARRTQAPLERGRLEEDRAWAEAWAGSAGL